MKFSISDAAAQDLQNQNYDPSPYYVCPDCRSENDADAEFCDDCGERLIFPSDWFSDEPNNQPAANAELSESLF